jgi:hypothetical protein
MTLVHTCHLEPLCRYWYSSHDHVEDPGGCIHESCMQIMNDYCKACYAQALDPTCPTHERPVLSWGEYTGYAGGICYIATYACGCTDVNESADVRAAR